jgi:hypothetical protein
VLNDIAREQRALGLTQFYKLKGNVSSNSVKYGELGMTRTANHLSKTRGTRFMGDQNIEIEYLSDVVCQIK